MKTISRQRSRARVRAKISGTPQRPRLVASISNRQIAVQIIDDTKATTLAHVTTVGSAAKGSMTEKAAWAGSQIATIAAKHKIKTVVFDRAGRIYHGRLHALAEAARKAGLEL